MHRYRLIDGLRAAAALLVLTAHVAFWTGASNLDVVGAVLARGDAGVAIFFAISAFLLLRPWLRAAATDGPRPDVQVYAVRRVARIAPAYWLALAGVLAVAALWPVTGGLGGMAKVVQNVFLLQAYTGNTYQGFSQTWSLTTEVAFYVLVPWLGSALGRSVRRSRRGTYLRLAGIAALGVAAQGVTAAWTAADPASHAGALGMSFVGHAAWFAAGAAVAVALETGDLERLRAVGTGTWWSAAAVLLLLASTGIAGPWDLRAPTVPQALAKEALYAIIGGLLVLGAARGPSDDRWRAVAASPVTRFAGDISYGVFLWHLPVIQLIYVIGDQPIFTGSFGAVLFATLIFSVLIAWASATLVELPILRWAHRATSRARPAREPARQG
ncbi:acyltransferase [Flexivirga sp. ID2601S]|uniref:Acyltransferase n=1 Tax=Flexivirga aerilata TaxID=1656889 RepID=A0A849APB8_9MICO|nr:acyltransferase [Flexivirga aerilata]